MSAPVDVFAVMDRYGFTCGDPTSDCSVARAAVAELIKTGNELLRCLRSQGITDEEMDAAIEAHDAALARCGGAK